MPVPDLPKVEIAIVEMTNSARRQHDLGVVKPNPALEKAARAYARYLASTKTLSHTADGRQPTDRAEVAGYNACIVSENLSSNLDTRGFETRQLAREAVEGWLKSPGHRKNLLAEHVVDIGVAVAKAPGVERYVSVQMFGRPATLAYQFRIDNTSSQAITYEFLAETYESRPRTSIEHTACMPGEVTFRRSGARAVLGRYKAKNGDVFVLQPAENGVKIEVTRSDAAAP